MCSPVALGAVAIGGGVMGAYGKLQQGKAAQQAAEYQAAVDEQNAKLADIQSADAETRGQIEREQIQLKARQVLGTGRTGYAAGNVMLDTGSPLTWEQDTAALAAQDVETSRHNTAMEKWGYQVEKTNALNSASMARASGKNAVKASKIGAVSSLLSSVGSTGMQALSMYRQANPGNATRSAAQSFVG